MAEDRLAHIQRNRRSHQLYPSTRADLNCPDRGRLVCAAFFVEKYGRFWFRPALLFERAVLFGFLYP